MEGSGLDKKMQPRRPRKRGIPDMALEAHLIRSSACHESYELLRCDSFTMNSSGTLEPLFPEVWLHERPRVTRAKGTPTHRVPKAEAFGYEYIEPNVTGQIQSLIITDRDKPDADRIADVLGLPMPSWVAINPHTTAGHIVYALKDPVPLTDAARRPPVNFLARVEHGLAVVLDGDPGYTGGLTKNPTHFMHPTLWGPEEARYSLRELATALDSLGALPRAGNARRNVSRSAVGRNVALFDETRAWAYKAVRRFWGAPSSEWERATYAHAWHINETRIANDFSTGGLSATEVGYLANSVAGWVWKKFTPEAFAARQAALGQKGGLKSAGVPRPKRKVITPEMRELIKEAFKWPGN